MNCLEVQTELAAGAILLNIFWSLRIPNTEEHFMFHELEKGMQGRLFGYMQALLGVPVRWGRRCAGDSAYGRWNSSSLWHL